MKSISKTEADSPKKPIWESLLDRVILKLNLRHQLKKKKGNNKLNKKRKKKKNWIQNVHLNLKFLILLVFLYL